MILRVLGGGLILACSVCVSLYLSAESRRKVENVHAVRELIGYIRRNIDSFLTPIRRILKEYRCDVIDGCGFGDVMRREGLTAAAEGEYLPLPKDAQTELLAFARSIGSGYRDEEIKRCEYYEGVLLQIEEREREISDKNRNLYRYLPPLGALSLLVVFM